MSTGRDEQDRRAGGQRRSGKSLHSGPIRIEPHGRDVYNRLVADVFVNEQNVAEILRSEGFSKAG
ncbi:MAG: hypothetical protein HZC50_04980 [Nitrospirae bacterium]|nr:hypothetical protein [Nitrospirota bacterium]